ncbi:hypothetical protein [Rhizobium leguminosarum]|uniref:hypothetical protein n=1 Tax=Rhizobium leguminosarum TaxID=384 RepID=UPI001C98B983|nr:hypothetical protein [Rhizobium leguminosarum]
MGPTGIGALLPFMDVELATSFLPAWLVIAYEHPYPYAGVLPAVVGVLDPEMKTDDEEIAFFQNLRASFDKSQRDAIAVSLSEMGAIHFGAKPALKDRLDRIAQQWRSTLRWGH